MGSSPISSTSVLGLKKCLPRRACGLQLMSNTFALDLENLGALCMLFFGLGRVLRAGSRAGQCERIWLLRMGRSAAGVGCLSLW